jgi:hypothetical protein
MFNRFSQKGFAILTATIVAVVTTMSLTSSASAASCTPIKPIGKTVGKISIGSVALPIKSFNYPAGGVMEPVKNRTSLWIKR